ncbi:MAG: GTPase Era [Syntrophobacteraceae bacterium CG07_land_8_20_14_0_80_61_8]|nr:MAG: GTPase Era [Syntrophobacteraceae bacterium CG07_land_8_20_14_0_80_61_8]
MAEREDEQGPNQGFRSGYVALLGAPNVGKSTLMNQLLQQKIAITAPKPQTTRNRIVGVLNRPQLQVIFLDTPGIHKARDRFNKILVDTALATLEEVDVICFVAEAPNPRRELDRFVLDCMRGVQTPVILALNKIDLMVKPELLPIIDGYQKLWPFAAIVPISALTGDGTEALLGELTGHIEEGPRYYPDDFVTDQPERFIVAELVREKVFHLTQQEVPYAVAVTVEKFKEQTAAKRIDIEATIHVERDSQKGIVIGKGAAMLKEIGRQARIDIERLLGARVYLGLFVRVQKDWRKDTRMLTELGYRGR